MLERRKNDCLNITSDSSVNLEDVTLPERGGGQMGRSDDVPPVIPEDLGAIKVAQKVDTRLGGKKIVMLSDSPNEISLAMPYFAAATFGYAEGLDASPLKSHEEILIRIAAANPAVLLIDKYLAHKITVTPSFIVEIQQIVPMCLVVIFTADDSAISTSGYKVIHKPLLYSKSEMSIVVARLSDLLSSNGFGNLGENTSKILSTSQLHQQRKLG